MNFELQVEYVWGQYIPLFANIIQCKDKNKEPNLETLLTFIV